MARLNHFVHRSLLWASGVVAAMVLVIPAHDLRSILLAWIGYVLLYTSVALYRFGYRGLLWPAVALVAVTVASQGKLIGMTGGCFLICLCIFGAGKLTRAAFARLVRAVRSMWGAASNSNQEGVVRIVARSAPDVPNAGEVLVRLGLFGGDA